MELSEMQARAAELEQLIADLPAGSITKKTVNGKEYFYHRWTEDKKRREKYIPADELEDFRAQIEQRKALERELKALKKQLPKAKICGYLLRLPRMSAPERRCAPLRHLFEAIASASASGSCTTMSTVSRRTRCSSSTVCAGRVKPP